MWDLKQSHCCCVRALTLIKKGCPEDLIYAPERFKKLFSQNYQEPSKSHGYLEKKYKLFWSLLWLPLCVLTSLFSRFYFKLSNLLLLELQILNVKMIKLLNQCYVCYLLAHHIIFLNNLLIIRCHVLEMNYSQMWT